MNMLFRAVLSALTACAFLAAGAVQADASGTTSFSNITLGVIDLTPQDGNSAGYVIDSFDSRLIAYTDSRNTGGSYSPVTIHPAPYTAGEALVTLGAASAHATTTGVTGDVTARANASAGLGLNNISSAESEQRLWLTLAPHTLLTISGNVLTQASRTLGAGEGYRVFTWAALDVTDSDVVTSTTLTRESPLIWGESATSAYNSEFFTLAFANPGDAGMAVSLNFLAYADVTIAAVPEPASYAMLLAGLLLLGAIAPRARRAP